MFRVVSTQCKKCFPADKKSLVATLAKKPGEAGKHGIEPKQQAWRVEAILEISHLPTFRYSLFNIGSKRGGWSGVGMNKVQDVPGTLPGAKVHLNATPFFRGMDDGSTGFQSQSDCVISTAAIYHKDFDNPLAAVRPKVSNRVGDKSGFIQNRDNDRYIHFEGVKHLRLEKQKTPRNYFREVALCITTL